MCRSPPNVTGTELNEPDQFAEGTNPISISRLTMDPNTRFERHTHPHNHVLVILEGGGFLIYDGAMDSIYDLILRLVTYLTSRVQMNMPYLLAIEVSRCSLLVSQAMRLINRSAWCLLRSNVR